MRYLFLIVLAFLFSCKGNNNHTAQKDTSSISIGKIDTAKNRNNNKDSIIQIKVNAAELPKTIDFSVLYDYQKVYIEIAGITNHKIHATMTAKGDNRNIRFNQIEMPDGSTDGPFGQNINYSVKQKGNYILIIGKDNMADGTLVGDATVSLSLP